MIKYLIKKLYTIDNLNWNFVGFILYTLALGLFFATIKNINLSEHKLFEVLVLGFILFFYVSIIGNYLVRAEGFFLLSALIGVIGMLLNNSNFIRYAYTFMIINAIIMVILLMFRTDYFKENIERLKKKKKKKKSKIKKIDLGSTFMSIFTGVYVTIFWITGMFLFFIHNNWLLAFVCVIIDILLIMLYCSACSFKVKCETRNNLRMIREILEKKK